MSHCFEVDRDGLSRHVDPHYYVLMEVPGRAGLSTSPDGLRIINKVRYELDKMPSLDQRLADIITDYEAVWAGVNKRTMTAFEGDNYSHFKSGAVGWTFAYEGAGPKAASAPAFARPKGRATKAEIEERHLIKFVAEKARQGNWLAKEMTDDWWFFALPVNFEAWVAHLRPYDPSDGWESDLEELWDEFKQGELSSETIRLDQWVHLTVDTTRTYCSVMVWREPLHDRLAWSPEAVPGRTADLPDNVREAVEAFQPATLAMFRRLEYRGSWMNHSDGRWYNIHVPVSFRSEAVEAITAAEMKGDDAPLRRLLASLPDLPANKGPSLSTVEVPHFLYRFYDEASTLLYVGITMDPGSRWKDHSKEKPWWEHVRSMTSQPYPTRAAVFAAEREAIKAEGPLHNIVHNRVTQ